MNYKKISRRWVALCNEIYSIWSDAEEVINEKAYDSEEEREYLTDIMRECKRLGAVIDDEEF